jgi:protein LTV1
MPPKSIWRSDKAQHFTLVHRSQQDPLIHDAEASSRVLKPTARKNQRQQQGQTREDLEKELGDYAKKQRSNVGEAAQYGIFYDDTEYDYMQHLRAVGDDYNRRRGGIDEEDDTEVIMLEAPKGARGKGKSKAKEFETGVQMKQDREEAEQDRKGQERTLVQLPPEVLPSEEMMPRTFEEEREKGIRPDMDPHLRQVLEALEDDAFLMRTAKGKATRAVEEEVIVEEDDFEGTEEELGDEEDIDDFFSGIVEGGELKGNDEEPEWRHLPPEGEESIWEDQGTKAARELIQLKEQGGGVEDLSLESRVALFKKAQEEQQQALVSQGEKPKRLASSVGSQSIFGEKGPTRKSRHPGAKARLAGTYYAPSADGGSTAFSMSSSAMERNKGLTGLDEQFDRMEKIYEQDSDEDDEEEDDEEGEELDVSNPADLDAIFDDFLNKNELVGNKLRERLGDRETTSSEKVDILRRELGDVRLVDKLSIDEADDTRESYDEVIMRDLKSREQIRQEWDVETVLTTRTNLENHPRTIASTTSHLPRSVASLALGNASQAGSNRMPRVRINPRTGVPEISGYIDLDRRGRHADKGEKNGDLEEKEKNGGHDSEDEEEEEKEDGESGAESDATEVPQNVTVTRDKNESKEEKKARKQAVKEQRRSIRKSSYQAEMSKQKRTMGGGLAKQTVTVKLS